MMCMSHQSDIWSSKFSSYQIFMYFWMLGVSVFERELHLKQYGEFSPHSLHLTLEAANPTSFLNVSPLQAMGHNENTRFTVIIHMQNG